MQARATSRTAGYGTVSRGWPLGLGLLLVLCLGCRTTPTPLAVPPECPRITSLQEQTIRLVWLPQSRDGIALPKLAIDTIDYAVAVGARCADLVHCWREPHDEECQ